MTTHFTYCTFHLGDNLFHLHFLRKMAGRHPDRRFVHAANCCHLPQLHELVEDLPNIELIRLEDRPAEAVNAWKNTDGFFGGMDQSPDYYEFYLCWFAHLAAQLGLESPFNRMIDLLFDYPALQRKVWPGFEFDTLVVNSQPCSGQWPAYDGNPARRAELDAIIAQMSLRSRIMVTQEIEAKEGRLGKIPCTREGGLTVTGIGNLSLRCRNIVMIGTGPAWPTCNAFNLTTIKQRIVLLEPERINFTSGIRHVANFAELRSALVEGELL